MNETRAPTNEAVREQVLKAYRKGEKPKALSEKTGISVNTIKSWIKRDKAKSAASGKDAPRAKKGASPKGKKGAPFGNQNAKGGKGGGAPLRNRNAEKHGAQFSSKNDSRITKVGRFIRATRLDELPQLLNIIKGDMSIVGPRPERQQYIEEFCQETPEFIYRLKVKAGLTGYAQIYGKYNTTPLDKLKLDLMYIETYSLLLDIRLIFLTLKIMFMKESTEGVEDGQNHA